MAKFSVALLNWKLLANFEWGFNKPLSEDWLEGAVESLGHHLDCKMMFALQNFLLAYVAKHEFCLLFHVPLLNLFFNSFFVSSDFSFWLDASWFNLSNLCSAFTLSRLKYKGNLFPNPRKLNTKDSRSPLRTLQPTLGWLYTFYCKTPSLWDFKRATCVCKAKPYWAYYWICFVEGSSEIEKLAVLNEYTLCLTVQ